MRPRRANSGSGSRSSVSRGEQVSRTRTLRVPPRKLPTGSMDADRGRRPASIMRGGMRAEKQADATPSSPSVAKACRRQDRTRPALRRAKAGAEKPCVADGLKERPQRRDDLSSQIMKTVGLAGCGSCRDFDLLCSFPTIRGQDDSGLRIAPPGLNRRTGCHARGRTGSGSLFRRSDPRSEQCCP